MDFNPRSPWGERPYILTQQAYAENISIHAPRGGSDCKQYLNKEIQEVFQSTLPVGGATFSSIMLLSLTVFQSTLPVGGATRSHTAGKAPF